MKVIETERLLVRNFTKNDWKNLQEYISKDEVMKFERNWDFSDNACQMAVEEFSKGDVFWVVELKTSGKMIGHVYFNQSQPFDFSVWSLGYIFNPDYSGKGYATESCRAVMEYGFKVLHIHRVIAKCSPDNLQSWRLLERLKMRREGHSLKCVTFKKTAEGEPIWWDEYLYAILAEEWLGFECQTYEK
jgi:[ribosomal protein S5]-alanine N-acetyltransferase